MSRDNLTKGKAAELELDAFDLYLAAKRREMRVTPDLFWRDFFWTLALVMFGAVFVVLLAAVAPALRAAFFSAIGVA